MRDAPNVADCHTYRGALLAGYQIGIDFVEDAREPNPGSNLRELVRRVQESDGVDRRWIVEDATFVVGAVRAFIGTAALQLHGLSALLADGAPINLHPLTTMIRSVAEATGNLWWQIKPWIDDDNVGSTVTAEQLATFNCHVLARSQLACLEELNIRRRRFKAHAPEDDPDYE
jgi:hypothetical protein